MIDIRSAVIVFLFVLFATWIPSSAMAMTQTKPATRITLVGASIGKDWNFDRIGERVKVPGYDFRYVGRYDFDKSQLIDALIGQAQRPDVVMIKECSSYFPGDMGRYQTFIRGWVGKLRGAGIQPVLVTAAPVKEPGLLQRVKNRAKKAMGKPVWPESVSAFNDWLRAYAAREGVPLFDLERALWIAPDRRYLKPEFSTQDDVHLSRAAYEQVDRDFERFLSVLNGLTAVR